MKARQSIGTKFFTLLSRAVVVMPATLLRRGCFPRPSSTTSYNALILLSAALNVPSAEASAIGRLGDARRAANVV